MRTHFSRPEGAIPLVHVSFVGFALRIHNFGAMVPKLGKIAPEIGKSHCKQKSQITRKRNEMDKTFPWTANNDAR